MDRDSKDTFVHPRHNKYACGSLPELLLARFLQGEKTRARAPGPLGGGGEEKGFRLWQVLWPGNAAEPMTVENTTSTIFVVGKMSIFVDYDTKSSSMTVSHR